MTPFSLPDGYPRVREVASFEELVTARFADGVNAFCWRRELPGDYAEVAEKLAVAEGLLLLDEKRLRGLPLREAGRVAVECMLADERLLREQGLQPNLDCIRSYPRDEAPEVVATDVYSFHVDSATTETDTWLCTYSGACSEGLRNEEALRRVDVPETRAALRELYGGPDDAEFADFLSECCYDLHYVPVPGAVPFPFGVGNLWRIAAQYPGSPVPPCIHRAPDTGTAGGSRLLLIS